MSMFDCPHCGDTHHVNDFCATGPMSQQTAPSNANTSGLAPCPFCGGNPFDRGFRRWECGSCGAQGPAGSKADATTGWNRRAAPASPLPGGGMRPDRIAELPDFLVALFDEWGEENHAEAAKQIVTFLTDSEGLERYRESYGLPAAPKGEPK